MGLSVSDHEIGSFSIFLKNENTSNTVEFGGGVPLAPEHKSC